LTDANNFETFQPPQPAHIAWHRATLATLLIPDSTHPAPIKSKNEPTELAQNKQSPNSNEPTESPIEATGGRHEPTKPASNPTPPTAPNSLLK
jgi:hypothetical protein